MCKPNSILECSCDLWFLGRVTSEAESRTPLESIVFAVRFIDGDEEEIEWEIKGTNNWWATQKSTLNKY